MRFTTLAYAAAVAVSFTSAIPAPEPVRMPHGGGLHLGGGHHPAPAKHSAAHGAKHTKAHTPEHTAAAKTHSKDRGLASKTHSAHHSKATHTTDHESGTKARHHSSTRTHSSSTHVSYDKRVWPTHPIMGADAPTPQQARKEKMYNYKLLPNIKDTPNSVTNDSSSEGVEGLDMKKGKSEGKSVERRFLWAWIFGPSVKQEARGDCPSSYEDVFKFMKKPKKNVGMLYGAVEDKNFFAWTHNYETVYHALADDYYRYNHMCDNFEKHLQEAWAHAVSGDVPVLLPALHSAQLALQGVVGKPPAFHDPPSIDDQGTNGSGKHGKGKGKIHGSNPNVDDHDSAFKDITSWPRLEDGSSTSWEKYQWPILQRNPNVCRVWRLDPAKNTKPLLLLVRNSPHCRTLKAREEEEMAWKALDP